MYGSERKENELNITIIQVCIPKIKRLNKIYKNGTDHKSQMPALQSYRYGGDATLHGKTRFLNHTSIQWDASHRTQCRNHYTNEPRSPRRKHAVTMELHHLTKFTQGQRALHRANRRSSAH